MGKWYRPGARPVERAREVGRTCWEALHRVDPDTARAIARAAELAGETWLTPQPATHGPDDLVTPVEAAELTGRSARWVYSWVAKDRDRRAIIGPDKRIRLRLGDLLDELAVER